MDQLKLPGALTRYTGPDGPGVIEMHGGGRPERGLLASSQYRVRSGHIPAAPATPPIRCAGAGRHRGQRTGTDGRRRDLAANRLISVDQAGPDRGDIPSTPNTQTIVTFKNGRGARLLGPDRERIGWSRTALAGHPFSNMH